jgi:hypothetical protein
MSPLGHVQVPFVQLPPCSHANPHTPQLFGSDCRVEQTFCPGQYVVPAPHPHTPFKQLSPAGHGLSHPPQCAGSLCRLRHCCCCGQYVDPVSPHAQTPARHAVPIGHSLPHVPQSLAVVKSVHVPSDAQYVRPAPHPHTPFVHA